ncbi:acyl-CoA synthetase [Tsukamurella ocularis]|uniref:acyl-CoA synthetase n=1 Tax=Tsukamurella ocularis TaxID=1970234 RepID=UPI0039F1258A
MNLTLPLHRALQQNADAVMTICGDQVRTTREVADRVARLAAALVDDGVRAGDPVALLSLNSDVYHEFFYATWWCGAAALPINTRWALDEIVYALNDSEAEVLILDAEFAQYGPELRETCPALRTVIFHGEGVIPRAMLDYEHLIAASEPMDDVRQGGDSLALLLYTGGTTGRPKGVMISHRGMFTSLIGTQLVNRAAEPGGVMLHTAPLFHIAAVLSWHSQNFIGGSHVFQSRFSPGGFLEAVQTHRVTTCALVPAMMQMICDHPSIADYDVSSLRRITYGGSASSDGLRGRAVRAFPTAGFGQGYGMTETGVLTILGPDESAEQRATGRAVAHVELAIHDVDGTPLPVGEIGEVVTRGEHVMMGYWKLPEVTAETLRGGWMHTGDLGYLDENGYLYVVDRLKDMIISGGENVYSAEVENAIATHPAVSSCAVIGLPDDRWGESVNAVIVCKPGESVTAEQLRAHVRERLAGYKVPRDVRFVTTLPTTATGKILKRELRAEFASAPADL